MSKNPYYRGPVSDHFDGTRFFVSGGATDKSRGDLWKLLRTKREAWPGEVKNPPASPLAPRIEGSTLKVTMIGHASLLIQTRGLNLLLDPVWSKRASPLSFAGPRRVTAPGVALRDLPPIDAILITHNHYDHLDLATLRTLNKIRPCRIVAPLGNDAIINQRGLAAETYDWGDSIVLSPDVRAHLVPTYHWSARRLGDRRMALWAGFVLETPDGPLYLIGDTAYRDGRLFRDIPERFGRPRFAAIPIGAYEPRWFMQDAHVDPAESVEIFRDCQAHHALACHWGTFQLTAEAREEPPRLLKAALAARGIDSERFQVRHPGETFDVPELPRD